MSFFVYIFECAGTTYYVSSTNDIIRRLKQHNYSKQGAHYTKIRRPVFLRYVENFQTFREARKREAETKRLKRIEKEKLFKNTA